MTSSKSATSWPPWDLERSAGTIAGYVLPDVVGLLLKRPPAPSGESVITRARYLYEAVAARDVSYEDKRIAYSTPGMSR